MSWGRSDLLPLDPSAKSKYCLHHFDFLESHGRLHLMDILLIFSIPGFILLRINLQQRRSIAFWASQSPLLWVLVSTSVFVIVNCSIYASNFQTVPKTTSLDG
ncbi:hypothetical protein C8Q75DRAFT_339319 [Abortiporus biennis]|nr:hypothetical protein C8Q75DRAFT_339319 [Abortiporus biennis]